MNIEEDLTSLKEIVAIRKERCDGFIESDGCLISTKRLETLLTAYEKEKEIVDKINKLNIPVDTLIAEFERLENLEDDRDMLKSELEKEKEKTEYEKELRIKYQRRYDSVKEKNKELEKQLQLTYQKQYINDLEAINHSNVSFN